MSSSWNGSYTYGDSAHLHAATAIGSSYSASYDAAGNMTCRAATNSTTCSGNSPSGAQLGYDNEGRLVTWQNAPTNPTTTAKYLYDGEGERVESQVTTSGPTTTTVYVGGLQDVVTTGSTTTITSYYPLGNAGSSLAVNGTLAYQATDHLGSAEVTLDGSGNVTGNRFYDPYGNGFASSGSMPGSYGFTGQHSDVGTIGLNYYHARYYDPTAGQFTSADTVRNGESRYAYVHGKPETFTDPSGHFCGEEAGCGDGNAVEATGFAGDFSAADAAYTDEAATEAEAQVEAQVAEEAQAGEREGPGGAEAVARAELAASDSPELLDEEMRGDELQRSADARDTQNDTPPSPKTPTNPTDPGEPPTNTTEPNTSPSSTDGTCSFAPETLVATLQGERAIGSLQVGEQVTAYDPSSGTTSTQTVQHVWVNHDTDLLDVTLATDTSRSTTAADAGTSKQQQADVASHGSQAPPAGNDHSTSGASTATTETVHTTANHPWLSAERGWVAAGRLTVGERVVRADGRTARVVGLRDRSGSATYYNLTVSRLHTYEVGEGQYVVHNCGGTVDFHLAASEYTDEERGAINDFIEQSNRALLDDSQNMADPWQRTSTAGMDRLTRAPRERWIRANAGSRPGPNWVAGHIPDTTWTGRASPPGGFMWLPGRANEEFGRQAQRYALGYLVTGFRLFWD